MAFTNQTNRWLLRLVAIALLCTSVFVLWRAFSTPTLPQIVAKQGGLGFPRSVSNAHVTRDLDEFAPMLSRSLNAPLYDPPPKESPKPEVKISNEKPRKNISQKVDSDLRVIGTMIEAGRSLAILVDSGGKIQLRGEGDLVEIADGDGRVVKIELRQVTILLDDETLTLKAPQ